MFKLTTKETNILVYLIKGYTNQQIADRLYVSIHTVKAELTSIYRKLNVNNRVEAAYLAGKNEKAIFQNSSEIN